jgi:hypothetical protein
VGFGWTNAAFIELLQGLPKNLAQKIAKEQGAALPANVN